MVDKDRLMAVISESIRTMSPYRGPLPIKLSAPSIRVDDLDPAVAQITLALSSPIKIVYKEKQWMLQPADLGQFIVQTPNLGGSGVTVSVDIEALGQWLYNLIGDRINREPVNAEIKWSDEQEQGRCDVSDSSKGVTLLAGPLADSVIQSLLGQPRRRGCAGQGHQARDRQRSPRGRSDITTKLGVGTSSFYGSDENRATNIWVGTGHLNGTIVRPGETFSFNNAIGDITPEAGICRSVGRGR